eukprot:756071-Pyramimonas_sp.AAC.1
MVDDALLARQRPGVQQTLCDRLLGFDVLDSGGNSHANSCAYEFACEFRRVPRYPICAQGPTAAQEARRVYLGAPTDPDRGWARGQRK